MRASLDKGTTTATDATDVLGWTATPMIVGTRLYSTIAGAAPDGLADCRITVHRAWTIGQLFPPAFYTSHPTDPKQADEVQVYTNGQWRFYWLHNNSTLSFR